MPSLDSTTIFIAFVITLIAHVGAKYVLRYINRYFRGIPMIIIAIVLTLIIIMIIGMPYTTYYTHAKPVFDRLLGYSTVLLAVPLAGMDFKGLPILSFATRSVTTPVGLSVAQIIDAPLVLANLIIIVSGILGAGVCRVLFNNITDDRAKGLALGLVAHAIGTVEAWTISPTAGRYAAFGLAINGLLTAVWLPVVVLLLLK